MVHSTYMKTTITKLNKTFINLKSVSVSIIKDFSKVHPVFKKYYKNPTEDQITNVENFLIENRNEDFLDNIYELFDELLCPCYEELKRNSRFRNCDDDNDSWEDYVYQGLCSRFIELFPEPED